MDPTEVEFIGEDTTIGIIPNFSFEPIHLISGTIGPFRAGLCKFYFIDCQFKMSIRLHFACWTQHHFSFLAVAVHVPLWLGIHLRKQQKCRLVPPEWMDLETLEDIKEDEKRSRWVVLIAYFVHCVSISLWSQILYENAQRTLHDWSETYSGHCSGGCSTIGRDPHNHQRHLRHSGVQAAYVNGWFYQGRRNLREARLFNNARNTFGQAATSTFARFYCQAAKGKPGGLLYRIE